MTERKQTKHKVAVAMSGGVDSGVAAALVVKAGYQAAGFHMKLWQEAMKGTKAAKHLRGGPKGLLGGGWSKKDHFADKCCDLESLEAARKMAHQLEMPFYVVDFEKIFKKKVVDYFLAEYAVGRTPNPCVMCNRFIKFGELLEYVRRLDYDYLATGHYAQVLKGGAEVAHRNFDSASDSLAKKCTLSKKTHRRSQGEASQNLIGFPRQGLTTDQSSSKRAPTPLFRLLMGKDRKKDQSYFLYSLTQSQLAHILFPVGDYTKEEVKKVAKKWKLPVAERPESQEICFFPESDYRPFLKRQISEKIIPGEVVDTKGRVIGRHKGLPLYTIGQRKGLGRLKHLRGGRMPSSDGEIVIPPYYVVAKDVKKNRLVVGFGRETERNEFWVKNVNWINSRIELVIRNQELRCDVRIRHGGELLRCKVRIVKPAPGVARGFRLRGGTDRPLRVKVVLDDPERGIAPGQAAVFYSRVKEPENERIKRGDYKILGGGIISD